MSIETKNYYDPYIDITVDISEKAKEFYRWWIPALESGDFLQATGLLRGVAKNNVEEAGYCCLGVAACGLMQPAFEPLRAGHLFRLEPLKDTGGLTQELQILAPEYVTGQEEDWDHMETATFTSELERTLSLSDLSTSAVLGTGDLIAGNDEHGADFLAIARALRLALVGKRLEAETVLLNGDDA